MRDFYTFQWPLQLQRITFSSLSVLCQLICRGEVVVRELHTKACRPFWQRSPRRYLSVVVCRSGCSFRGNILRRRARRPDPAECNHKRDLLAEKIVKMKGERRTKGGREAYVGGGLHKCLVIISGCPIYLTLTIPSRHREEENMFSSPRRGLWWTVHDTISHRTSCRGFTNQKVF